MNKPTWNEFLHHYHCEWDTDEFLGWNELRICMEQLGMLCEEQKENRFAEMITKAREMGLDIEIKPTLFGNRGGIINVKGEIPKPDQEADEQ
jgi:hypothetical protein